jgi:predicted RNA-binding Zn-ribbon protein involved in translation (DUF1610 family)
MVLDSIKNPLLEVGKGVSVLYESAWLSSEDEAARLRAVSSLERIGGVNVVDILIHILSHDPSSSVVEGAAHSLGRAGGEKSIDALVKMARKRASLVRACAQGLGEMHTKESIESLKELLAYFEDKELLTEADEVRQVIQSVEHGEGNKAVMCIVCGQSVEEREEVVGCPICGRLAHKAHMLEWLHVHGTCPSCQHDLRESELLEPSMKTHQ